MVDSRNYQEWLRKAEQDLKGAQIMLGHEGINDLIAFHSQQAVEKILKAYILFKSNELLEGHSLVYLNKQCQKYDNSFADLFYDSNKLNAYYIQTRYPADIPLTTTEEEALDSVKIAEKIIGFVKSKMK